MISIKLIDMYFGHDSSVGFFSRREYEYIESAIANVASFSPVPR